MKNLKLTPLSLLIGAAFAAAPLWAQAQQAPPTPAPPQAATDVGKIDVNGQPGGTSTGLITPEDTPKARSSVTREHLDTMLPTSNPYQALSMLPGVSTFSDDATGLFGGGMRIRGFNSDQMGFTINGAPVNDSGSFAIYPQEYVDQENLCSIFVTQGSTDTDAPHLGASGGNIGMVSCSPSDTAGGRFTQSFGQLDFHRTFLRGDTGKMFNDSFKAYLSVSEAQANKFKGEGDAKKTHLDFGAEFAPTKDLFFSTNLLYNDELNNNYETLSYANIAQYGWNYDYSSTRPVNPAPVNGVIKATTPSNPYYGYELNPFKNSLWTAKAEYKVDKDLKLSFEPYFWYGFGTGGNLLSTVSEGLSASKVGGGLGDLNGDGNTSDTLLAYGGSVTTTYRPGATLKATGRLGSQNLEAGLWFEQARQIQTGPRELINADGSAPDLWLNNSSSFIRTANGQPYEARDFKTVTTGTSAFIQDSFDLVPDKLNFTLGLRDMGEHRDFTNFPSNYNSSSYGYYEVEKSYDKVLPSLSAKYTIDAQRQVFFNIAENAKAPANYVLESLIAPNSGTWANGVYSGFTLQNADVVMETSVNMDAGFRYADDAWTFSSSAYLINFSNRIATSYDAERDISTDYNVGSEVADGVDLEAGYKVNQNWALYGSASYINTEMLDNKVCTTSSAASCLPTAGKQMPNTPNLMAALSVNYNEGGFFAQYNTKFTSHQYATLVNDQMVQATTLTDITAGYHFGKMGFLKNPTLMLNMSNVFNKKYVNINSASGSSIGTYSQAISSALNSPQTIYYYVGAPRFTALTLRSDF